MNLFHRELFINELEKCTAVVFGEWAFWNILICWMACRRCWLIKCELKTRRNKWPTFLKLDAVLLALEKRMVWWIFIQVLSLIHNFSFSLLSVITRLLNVIFFLSQIKFCLVSFSLWCSKYLSSHNKFFTYFHFI